MTGHPPSEAIVLIPARLASSRLPEKPLADICGLPMIVQVWKRAMEASIGRVIVAAGDQAIVDAVKAHGGEAVMTDADLPSGSDRITSALAEIDPGRRYQRVVNLQGDLPTIDPTLLKTVLRPISPRWLQPLRIRSSGTIRTWSKRSSPLEEAQPNPSGRTISAGPFTSPEQPHRPDRDPFITISAFMRINVLLWSASPPCRQARSSNASVWSSYVRWNMA